MKGESKEWEGWEREGQEGTRETGRLRGKEEVKEGKRKIGKRKGEVGKQKENVWGM